MRCNGGGRSSGLPRLGLLLIFKRRSKLPFCCHGLTNGVPSSGAIGRLLRSLSVLNFNGAGFIVSENFCSRSGVGNLCHRRIGFLMNMGLSLGFVGDGLSTVCSSVHVFAGCSRDVRACNCAIRAR